MRPGFAAIGNLCVDDLVFADGTTQWGIPGGNAMYAGLGMAVWDESAAIVAPVGPDYPLDRLAGRLDVSLCPKLPRTLRNWGLYEEDGTRHFVFRSQTRRWLDFSPKPADVAGCAAAAHLAPLPFGLHLDLIAALRGSGARLLSVDLDDRDLAAVPLAELARLIAGVDLFLPSRQDARAIFPEAAPLDALRRLRDLAPQTPLIAVKCGPEGCLAHAAGAAEAMLVPAYRVPVADATGAGDCFCGGALVGFARSGDPRDALLHGAVAASFCVEGIGCAGLIGAGVAEARRRLEVLRDGVRLVNF